MSSTDVSYRPRRRSRRHQTLFALQLALQWKIGTSLVPLWNNPSRSSRLLQTGGRNGPLLVAVTETSGKEDPASISPVERTFSKVQHPFNESFVYAEGDDDPLSLRVFNVDLKNLSEDDPQKAQDALDIMIEMGQGETNMTVVTPDISSYLTVVEAWIERGQLEKAQSVFDEMEKRFFEGLLESKPESPSLDEKSNSTISPIQFSYWTMIQGWVDNTKNDFAARSAQRAEDLLRRMESHGIAKGSVKLWTIVLEGWCRRSGYSRGAMAKAEALVREMELRSEDTSDESNKGIKPNVMTYTSLIGGYAKSKEKDKARSAEAVLARMRTRGIQPDMVAYTSVINCWGKAVSRRERDLATTRTLRILDEMERLYLSNQIYQAKPSLITYSTAISAIGNSNEPNVERLTDDVVKRMYRLRDTGAIANMKPNTGTFNAVIHALSSASKGNKVRHARRAEQILYEMIDKAKNGDPDVAPDVRSWAAVLRAWSRCRAPDAAANTQRVLDDMKRLFDTGKSRVRPNFVCYTTAMSAWSQSKSEYALEKLEAILKYMEEAYEKTREPDIRPNTISYVTAIDAIVRRNGEGAAEHAQATVDRMLSLYAKGLGHVRPTRAVFNSLINAWAKSMAESAATRAEAVFQWMEKESMNGHEFIRPNDVSLCAVLNAWANQGTELGAQRAEQIWNHAESISEEERGFPLTIAMPNTVIKAILRSRCPDVEKRAERVLCKLEADFEAEKSSLRPDVTTYSSVIAACANYSGPTEGCAGALKIALDTFRRYEGRHTHNSVTYGSLLKAIANLMPIGDEREELVQLIFDKCTEEGLVDSFVLANVRHVSPQLFRDLVTGPCGLGASETDIKSVVHSIPSEWSANVVE